LRTHPATKDVPIILCTGATEEVKPLVERLEQFEVPVVLKPFAIEHLQQVVSRVLRAARSEQSLSTESGVGSG
jgi:CheY-like chemotaxis protein